MKRYFPALHDCLVILAAYFLFVNQLDAFANDPGVGWHLLTGNYILSEGSIPFSDPFLFSDAHRAWISDQWLSDLILAIGFKAGGFPLVYLGFTLLYFTLFFLILYQTLRSFGAHPLGASLASLAAFKMSLIHFILRPTLFGIFLFAVCGIRILQTLKKERVEIRDYFLFSFLFFLWANIHPSFPLGFLLLGLLVLQSVCLSLKTLKTRDALILMTTSMAATFINPNGPFLHLSILELTGSSYFMLLNEEWLPIAFNSPEGVVFLLSNACFFGFCLKMLRSKTITEHIFVIGASLILFLMTLRSVRYLPYFAVIASFPISLFLSDLFTFIQKRIGKPFGFAYKRAKH